MVAKKGRPQLDVDLAALADDAGFGVPAYQGELEKAKELVHAARECGVDAVKLQKRDNRRFFTRAFYDSPYDNENSFGRTYGEHREAVELGKSDWFELSRYAREEGLAFVAAALAGLALAWALTAGRPRSDRSAQPAAVHGQVVKSRYRQDNDLVRNPGAYLAAISLVGLLVLIGSLAMGRRRRQADAVITRVLGASRIEVLSAAVLRYILLAAFAALLATPIGIALAWLLTTVLLAWMLRREEATA